MDLYFAPLACSMASRIGFYEAGVAANFIQVDMRAKRTLDDGADYLAVNPLGLVPAIRTDEGAILIENAAILRFLSERFASAGLAPHAELERDRMMQWLSFLATELHKAMYIPMLDSKASDEIKDYARRNGEKRLDYIDRHLKGREYLLDTFSIADAFLFTVLNWSAAVSVDLNRWPALKSYYSRLRRRPSIAKALDEERELYAQEQARHKAA